LTNIKKYNKKKTRIQKQSSKDNIGDSILTGDRSKVYIDKSKHIHVEKDKKGKSKKRKIITNKDKDSDDKTLKSKIPKEKKENLVIKPIIIENEIFLNEYQYCIEQLGELKNGDVVLGSFKDTLGKNFSYYLVDQINKISFATYEKIHDSIRKGKIRKEFKINCKIKYKGFYYIIFTHRTAISNINYRIEILKKE
jgi:hypothetical protein